MRGTTTSKRRMRGKGAPLDAQGAARLLETTKGRPGIVAVALDGRIFFLTEALAKKAAVIDRDGACAAYVSKRKGQGTVAKKSGGGLCRRVKKFLDTNDPDSNKWRSLSMYWGNHCL